MSKPELIKAMKTRIEQLRERGGVSERIDRLLLEQALRQLTAR